MSERLEQLAREVATVATSASVKIVLAESCTAGLVAQSLSRVPGASQWLCGSAVVYRNETKSAWLGIDANKLADPEIGPVSSETAAAMCAGVLSLTPEADLAASVTGHLGPDAPSDLDGLIYIGTQNRRARQTGASASIEATRLPAALPDESAFGSLRHYRQHAAAEAVLSRLIAALSGGRPDQNDDSEDAPD